MLIDLLELASNKALEHDPQTQQRLAKLLGKTMRLHIRPIDQSISVTPFAEGLEFSRHNAEDDGSGHIDVTLSATINALVKISRSGIENAELQPGELEIQGDPIIGQRFAQVLADLNIDWEAALAEQIGDSPARVASIAAEHAKEFAEQSRLRFKEIVNQILTNDLDVVASKDDVEPFLDSVDILRADAERLMARVKRLDSKID